MGKKCPYCGATLQENARFCLYCMRPLEQQTKKSTNKWVIVLLCVLLASALVTGGFFMAWFLLKDDAESETATVETEGDGEPSLGEELPYGKWPIICSLEDMTLRTVYLTAVDDLSALWDPDGFVYKDKVTDDDGDDWKIYETEVYLGGVCLRAHFGGDGREIITSITSLTDENYEDGIRLAECMVSSVYNYTFTNLHGMLTDGEAYPRLDVPLEDELLLTAQLPDPAVNDPGSRMELKCTSVIFDEGSGFENQALYVEFRTRTCNGQTVYDIIILHTQDL